MKWSWYVHFAVYFSVLTKTAISVALIYPARRFIRLIVWTPVFCWCLWTRSKGQLYREYDLRAALCHQKDVWRWTMMVSGELCVTTRLMTSMLQWPVTCLDSGIDQWLTCNAVMYCRLLYYWRCSLLRQWENFWRLLVLVHHDWSELVGDVAVPVSVRYGHGMFWTTWMPPPVPWSGRYAGLQSTGMILWLVRPGHVAKQLQDGSVIC